MAKSFGLFLVLAVALAIAAGAVALMPAGAAGAQASECRDAGVVPGSVEAVSTNNLAGEVSGHTIRFQLCLPGENAAPGTGNGVDVARPVEIGLLWDWFNLSHPEQAGITLTATETGQSWNATAAIDEGACYFRVREVVEEGGGRAGVYAALTGDDFAALVPAAGRHIPINLAFNLPASAGMLNPIFPDHYQWQVVLRYDRGDYWETYIEAAVTPVASVASNGKAVIRLSHSSGAPGSRITIVGSGFPPLSPVQRVQVAWADVTPDNPAAANARGELQLDIIIPWLDDGRHTIGVLVNGTVTTIEFTVLSPATLGIEPRIDDALRFLGDNFVRAFRYHPETKNWNFYDPEIPEVSTLEYLIPGEAYWILLKSPVTGVGYNLNCAIGGNFWNVIVW